MNSWVFSNLYTSALHRFVALHCRVVELCRTQSSNFNISQLPVGSNLNGSVLSSLIIKYFNFFAGCKIFQNYKWSNFLYSRKVWQEFCLANGFQPWLKFYSVIVHPSRSYIKHTHDSGLRHWGNTAVADRVVPLRNPMQWKDTFQGSYWRLACWFSKILCTRCVSRARCLYETAVDLPQGGLEVPCTCVRFLSWKTPVHS